MAEYQGKYVNEETHKKMKKIFNRIGIALIVLGSVMIVGGIALVVIGIKKMTSPDFFESGAFGGGYVPGGSFLIFFALAFISSGIVIVVRAHTRELASFAVSSVAPVAKDTIGYASQEILPEVGTAIGNVAKSFNKSKTESVTCKKCGKLNKKTSKFCQNCGASLEQKHCTVCGSEIEDDAIFCTSCGTKIEK